MAIPSVGSKSLDDRRRRRLAVTGEGAPANDELLEGFAATSGRVESELVGSEAAAPWVPFYEWRIWTYGAMLGLLLIALSFALTYPTAFRPELAPLTKQLLLGDRPILGGLVQATLWFLCAQMAVLIAWYRVQCKLDFDGRYRVWPWAAVVFGSAAFCSLTNAHGLFGEIIAQFEWLPWRGGMVAWLLPACVVSIPLMLLVDRDVQRGRSTTWTLRTAWLLGLTTAGLELFAPELLSQNWYRPVRLIVPLFAVGTLFMGLWLHARIVAYVSPDPPESGDLQASSLVQRAVQGTLQLMSYAMSRVSRLFTRRPKSAAAEESEAKPRRRSRKVADPEETPKRKRKPAAKRVTKPRTRVTMVDDDEDEEQDELEDEYNDNDSADSYEANSEPDQSSDEGEWDESTEEVEAPPVPVRSTRSASVSAVTTSASAGSQKKPVAESWQQRPAEPSRATQPVTSNPVDVSDEEDESSEGDASYRLDDGLTAEQMRGLSKRQKRELRQKVKDQQRNSSR